MRINKDEIESVYDRQILSIDTNAKTVKGNKLGYLTGILYLAPSDLSGINVCPKATDGCKAACLFSAGRGKFENVHRARLAKTLAFHQDKERFFETLKLSIRLLVKQANRDGLIPVVRLNGTSDIAWEVISDIIQSFPEVQFYDYTKVFNRLLRSLPKNYNLTFSLSENNGIEAKKALLLGFNVSVVFENTLPKKFLGRDVTSGDETDLRFLDGKGIIVGLTAKGKAKNDESGFVKKVG